VRDKVRVRVRVGVWFQVSIRVRTIVRVRLELGYVLGFGLHHELESGLCLELGL
jgi:hypothetical protein